MTITSQTSKSGPYSGNDSTTTFAYTFLATDEEHLIVTLLDADGVTETVQTLGAAEDYTVTGVGTVSGGTVEMAVPPATGEQLLITRSVPKTQEINLQNRAALVPEIIEDSFDKLTQIVQDLQGLSDRSLKIGTFDDLVDVAGRAVDRVRDRMAAEGAEALAVAGEVEGRVRDVLAADVFPDVEFGPVGDREDAQRLTRATTCVVDLPQLGALPLRVPLVLR